MASTASLTTGPNGDGPQADFNQLRDPMKQQQMRQDLISFLIRHDYQEETKQSLSPETMSSPTKEEFDCMFKFLYHQIEPSYQFQESMHVEVPPLLRRMRYPHSNTISKSQIAFMSPNQWPTFVVLFHWMAHSAMDDKRNFSSVHRSPLLAIEGDNGKDAGPDEGAVAADTLNMRAKKTP